jgi:hypothetical protein
VDAEAGLITLGFSRPMTDEDPALLRRIPKLGTLMFLGLGPGPSATDEDLARLKGIAFRGLMLQKPAITDAGLAALKECPALESLALNEYGITDSGVAHLRDMPQLTKLTLTGSTLTEGGLVHVGQMRQLTSLSLVRCQGVTDEHLRRCQRIVERGTAAPGWYDAAHSPRTRWIAIE